MIVKIPEDILAIESKIFGPFTKRQWISILLGVLVIAPTFIVLFWKLGSIDFAAVIAVIAALPIMASGFISHHGMYINRIMLYRLRRIFKYPRKRKYITECIYEERNEADGTKNKKKTVNKKTAKKASGEKTQAGNHMEGEGDHSEQSPFYSDI